MITGKEEVSYYDHFAAKYLESAVALSLGCGTGHHERRWSETGRFERIYAYDMSETRIEYARQQALKENISNIDYQVADINDIEYVPTEYDVVIGAHSIHHFAYLDSLFSRIRQTLKPNGYFFIDEFVGPARFQWTDRQLEATNALLRVLPDTYRRRQDGTIKSYVYRPSLASMILYDPSEAIESNQIPVMLQKHFEVLEIRPYGGTILHLLFAEIAHNFLDESSDTRRILQICFDVEDCLLASGEIASDFAFIVAKPR